MAMLPRFSTRVSSNSLHLVHRCIVGPHILQQVLFWHGLSQEEASTCSRNIFIFPSRSERDSRETRQRDCSLKYFVRAFTDGTETHLHSDGVALQVLSPSQAHGKEADGEVKFSRSQKLQVALGKAQAKSSVQSKNVKEEGSAYSRRAKASFWKRLSYNSASNPGIDLPSKPTKTEELTTDAGLNEEPATETSKEVKVISVGSKQIAEVHTVPIQRRLTSKFLCQLQEKVDFLHSLAVPVTQVKILLKKRAFLSASPEKLVMVVEVLTENFESKSIALKVLTANAGILARPLDMLKHKMDVLSRFEIDRRARIKLGITKGMWTLRIQNYEQKLNFLTELGMDARARSNLLRRCPLILRYSESSLRASVDFLESIGICGPDLLKFLELRPTVFCSSVDKRLAVIFKLFRDWGFSINEVIRALRQLLLPLCSAERIQSQYKLLLDQGISRDDAAHIIRRRPSVLASTKEDLKAKLDFLGQVDRDISEVLKFPTYLACSLEDRIIPRFRALEAVRLSEKPRLSSILGVKASIFKRRFDIPESVKCL